MKRVREDAHTNPQSEDSSSRETNGQPPTIKRTLTSSDAMDYLKAVEVKFRNRKKFMAFLKVISDFKARRIDTAYVMHRMTNLFMRDKDLLLGFNTFLPQGYRITPPDEEKPRTEQISRPAVRFIYKVKTRFIDDEHAHKRVLYILKQIRKERSISDFYEEVTMLFKDHEDLFMEFLTLVPDGSKLAYARNTVPCTAIPPMHSDKVTLIHNKSAASGCEDIRNHKRPLSATKYAATPINQLDLSECTQITPSYFLMPHDYQVHIPKNRTDEQKCLSYHLVSVNPGSGDYSSSHSRKNKYEERLFKCEDDRYEMDMLLESVRSAIKNVENLLGNINNKTISIDTLCIQDHLSAMNLRCIERLYGENGLDVMEFLKKNVHTALPVILKRLKQKQEEWTSCHSDFQNVWARVNAKNHKALNRHNFWRKQQDS